MSQTGVVAWSQTAASNSTADSNVNWAEGMAPSAVNDSARAEMSSVAKYRDDTAGTLTTAGTSTAYTLTTNQVFSSLTVLNGQELSVKFNATNGAAPTLNVDTLGAKAINVDTATAVGTGVIKANSVWSVVYDNSNSCFILKNVPAAIQDGTVATASLAANAVTLAKLATQADLTVIGNASGGVATPAALTLSGFATTSTSITAPHPPAGAFSNLSIKVATNTTVAVAADYVTMFNGSSGWLTAAISQTVNMGTTGAGALDTGTIATGTVYAIWAIAKADGTTSAIASASFTSPTMPSGYSYKARIGAVITTAGSAILYGTWQFGRRVRYVLGLAGLTTSRTPITGSSGDVSTPIWTAISLTGYVPTTASSVAICLFNSSNTGVAMAAPNNSYGASLSTTKPPPFVAGAAQITNMVGEILLESTSIYYASAVVAAGIAVLGWEDNI